jgi:hypothetical protein
MANLIFDYTVPSNTSSVTIDLSSTPIQKGELYELSGSVIAAFQTYWNYIFVNGNNTVTNYWNQIVQMNGTLNQSERVNFPGFGYALSGRADSFNIYIKLTNSGYVVLQTFTNMSVATTTPLLQENAITSTFTVSSITSLQIATQTGGAGIATGSTFKLRKVADKVAEIEVASPTTSAIFDNLTFGKDNEYLLVSEHKNATTNYHRLELYFNNNNTATNYWRQMFRATGTSTIANRANWSEFSEFFNNTTDVVFAIGNIKLTNNGYGTWQSNNIFNVNNGSNITLQKLYGTTTFTMSSITKLELKHTATNGIAAGSRFELYKLI